MTRRFVALDDHEAEAAIYRAILAAQSEGSPPRIAAAAVAALNEADVVLCRDEPAPAAARTPEPDGRRMVKLRQAADRVTAASAACAPIKHEDPDTYAEWLTAIGHLRYQVDRVLRDDAPAAAPAAARTPEPAAQWSVGDRVQDGEWDVVGSITEIAGTGYIVQWDPSWCESDTLVAPTDENPPAPSPSTSEPEA